MNPNTNGNQNAYHYAPGQAPRGAQTPPPYQNAPNPNPYPYQNPQWQQNPNGMPNPYGMPPQPPKKKRKIWPIVLIIIIAVVVLLCFFSAVILVPTIVGYVKQVEKENAKNECTSAVSAAQTIVSSAYASMDGTYEAEDGTEIQFDQDALADGELDITAEAADAIEELSEVDGTVISVISDEAKISYLKYRAESGQVVVYEDPDGESGSYTVK